MSIGVLLSGLMALASSDQPMQHGFDARLGYLPVSVGSDFGISEAKSTASPGFQGSIGLSFWIPVQDDWAVHAGTSLEWDAFSVEIPRSKVTETLDFSALFLGFQVCGGYQATESLALKLGVQLDIPVGGQVDQNLGGTEKSYDVVWAPGIITDYDEKTEIPLISVKSLVAGAAWDLRDDLQITAQGKFALGGILPHYDGTSLDGAQLSKDNLTLHQFALGVTYRFLI